MSVQLHPICMSLPMSWACDSSFRFLTPSSKVCSKFVQNHPPAFAVRTRTRCVDGGIAVRPGLLRDFLSPGMQWIVKHAFGPAAPEVADQRCRVEQPLLLHVQRRLLDGQLSR